MSSAAIQGEINLAQNRLTQLEAEIRELTQLLEKKYEGEQAFSKKKARYMEDLQWRQTRAGNVTAFMAENKLAKAYGEKIDSKLNGGALNERYNSLEYTHGKLKREIQNDEDSLAALKAERNRLSSHLEYLHAEHHAALEREAHEAWEAQQAAQAAQQAQQSGRRR